MYILVLVISSSLAFALAALNGAFSVGSMLGVASSARIIRQAYLLLYTVISFLAGAILVGAYTSRTFASRIIIFDLVEKTGAIPVIVIATLISTIVWSIAMLKIKIPVSITQLAIGGLLGSGLGACGKDAIQWNTVLTIVSSWVATAFLSMALAIFIVKLDRVLDVYMRDSAEKIAYLLVFIAIGSVVFLITNRYLPFNYAILISGVVTSILLFSIKFMISKAFSKLDTDLVIRQAYLVVVTMILAMYFGAHDIGSSAGLLSMILTTYVTRNMEVSITASLSIVSIGFFLGAYLWGSRIMETIAGRITPLTIDTSLIVQLSVIYTIFVLLMNGIPSSITMALIGGIAGVGYARGLQYVDNRLLLKINTLWILGVALSTILSFAISSAVMTLA